MKGVKTIICPNPECKREYGLFWNVSGEKTKVLSYCCEKHRIKKVTGYAPDGSEVFTMRKSLQALIAPEGIVPTDELTNYWTPAYRRKVTLKKNLQLVMTNK